MRRVVTSPLSALRSIGIESPRWRTRGYGCRWLHRIGADHGDSPGWPINVVPALKTVAADHLGVLQQFPDGVFAGCWQAGVIHQRICKFHGAITELGCVLSGAGVSLQLDLTQRLASWIRHRHRFGLEACRSSEAQADQKLQGTSHLESVPAAIVKADSRFSRSGSAGFAGGAIHRSASW